MAEVLNKCLTKVVELEGHGPDFRGTGKKEFINLMSSEFRGTERQENQDDFPGLWSGLSMQSTDQVRNTGRKVRQLFRSHSKGNLINRSNIISI